MTPANTDQLCALGMRLRHARLARNEDQKTFSIRVGVSVPTYRKMEAGNPGVAIGHWVQALWILGRDDDIDRLLAPTGSLFDRYEREKNMPARQRAGGRACARSR